MKKTIYFSDREDPRTGFLSNESKHSFLLEDKYYPTVEHYFLSKKFEGTAWEEYIRQAPTVLLAKYFATPRKISSRNTKGDRIFEDYYGDGKNRYATRVGWADETYQKTILKKAIIAKFEQNVYLQDKLLETRNIRLIDTTNPFTGEVLEEYRSLLHRKKLKIQSDEEKYSGIMKDVNISLLKEGSTFAMNLIEFIYNIAIHFESKTITKEMVEDIILVITPPSSVYFCMEYIVRFSKVSSGDLYQKLPNMNKLVTCIEDTIAIYAIKDYAKYAKCIYSFVKWVLMESGKEKDNIVKKLEEFQEDPMKIVFPQKKRSYRKENTMKRDTI